MRSEGNCTWPSRIAVLSMLFSAVLDIGCRTHESLNDKSIPAADSRGIAVSDAGLAKDAIASHDFLGSGAIEHASVERRTFILDAAMTYENLPGPAPTTLRLVMRLDRKATSVTGHLATTGKSAGYLAMTGLTSTSPVSGTLLQRNLVLAPFSLKVTVVGASCQLVTSLKVDSFVADMDWNANVLSGAMSGKAKYLDDDALGEHGFEATFVGRTDNEAPKALVTPASDLHVLGHTKISFSEPVTMQAGAAAVTLLANGSILVSTEFEPGSDSASAVDEITVSSAGHLPFSTNLNFVTSPELADLAGNRLVMPSTFVTTIPDPGPLTNFGFETGSLDGFVANSGATCAEVTTKVGAISPKEGLFMAYFPTWCLADSSSSRLTARLDLPATAKTLTIAGDIISNFSQSPPPSFLTFVVAGKTSRKSLDIVNTLGSPSKPAPNASSFPSYHTGFQDMTIDVSGFAGESIAVVVGRDLDYEHGCGHVTPPSVGLLLDSIRIQ